MQTDPHESSCKEYFRKNFSRFNKLAISNELFSGSPQSLPYQDSTVHIVFKIIMACVLF